MKVLRIPDEITKKLNDYIESWDKEKSKNLNKNPLKRNYRKIKLMDG